MAPVVVTLLHVVGPIGAGKSSLLERVETDSAPFVNALKDHFPWLDSSTLVVTAPEVPAHWTTADGRALLPLMYDYPDQYAAEFQSAVLRERVKAAWTAVAKGLALLDSKTRHLVVVTDGSPAIDYGVFARASREAGFFTDEQWLLYTAVFNKIESTWIHHLEQEAKNAGLEVTISIGGTLYLTTELGETEARIKSRGRACEQKLPLTYLADIIARHEFVLASATYTSGPVVRILDTPLDSPTPLVVVQ